ncbi:MAG: oligosaccharide flippase family protein [Solirubrobacteraceae bacterium]
MSAAPPAEAPPRDMRRRVARGTMINGAFLLLVNGVGLLRGFIVAAFLTASDYGLWGVILILLYTLVWLKQAGIGEKYIQQTEADQELAFQRAFSVELALSFVALVIGLILVPLLALAVGQHEAILPGLLLLLALPAMALQSPLWIFARRLDFARQRRLQAVDPLVGFVVTVVLVAAGAGYWGLLAGTLAGAWTAAAVSWRVSPIRMRAVRLERETIREYAAFSWPLLVSGATTIVFAQSLAIVGTRAVGLAGVGAISLSSTLNQFAGRADQAVTDALYPAICRVVDRTDLLLETFLKSNRLALLWGVPYGVGACLFAPDLVHFVLGSNEWGHATTLLQVVAACAAAHQVGFNWDSFYRAQGRTRQTGVMAVFTLVVFLVVTVPLLATKGLDGLAVGMIVQEVATVGLRWYYLGRLFPGFHLPVFLARSIAPQIPVALLIVGVRLGESGERTWWMAAGELALYGLATLAVIVLLERTLVREAMGYLRRRPLAA